MEISDESLEETLDILETDPDILKKLKAAEKDTAAGHYTTWRKGQKHK